MLPWKVQGFSGKPAYHVLEPSDMMVWIVNARHMYRVTRQTKKTATGFAIYC
jgi:hypothetical protein